MFDAYFAPEQTVGPTGHVTCRVHTGRGAQILVTHHSVAQLESGRFEPTGGRCHAHTHHDHVGRNDLAVGETDSGDRARLTLHETVDLHVASHRHTVLFVDPRDQPTHLGTETANQRGRRTFEHRHLATPRARRGRHFQSDETGTDHHDSSSGHELVAQRQRVRQCAQTVYALPVGLTGKSAHDATGGDHHTVGVESTARPQGHDAIRRVEGHGRVTQHPFHVQGLEDLGFTQPNAIGVPLSRQHLLRQRRAVVGNLGLVAHDHDGSAEFLLPQGLGGTKPGE